ALRHDCSEAQRLESPPDSKILNLLSTVIDKNLDASTTKRKLAFVEELTDELARENNDSDYIPGSMGNRAKVTVKNKKVQPAKSKKSPAGSSKQVIVQGASSDKDVPQLSPHFINVVPETTSQQNMSSQRKPQKSTRGNKPKQPAGSWSIILYGNRRYNWKYR
ncbi:unnamed protein product, partial [Allacma fusca]